jgi:hypothetical protein
MLKVDILLRRLEQIHKDLGGSLADAGVSPQDRFGVLRLSIESRLHSIESSQSEHKLALESHAQ